MPLAVRWPVLLCLAVLVTCAPGVVRAAPYAAMVVDARTGEVLHSRNADTPLHPASLTKMMTLFIAFEAVERGEISLDTEVRISRFAASEPPSKLGLKSGQTIRFRYLIRAAAVKSANDAATAIGEALEGSEAAFARRMNRTAKSLGMSRTTFRNAHGLTESGHLSTARDMTTLGRHLLYGFPEYYNLFSRRATHAGVRDVANTNRRLLAAYRGADGIKTGYTRAAGFNLVASAERGDVRVIATVFGGKSTASRNARVAELLDMGFARAPAYAALVKPLRQTPGRIVRDQLIVAASPRPAARPGPPSVEAAVVAAVQESVVDAVTDAVAGRDTAAEASAPQIALTTTAPTRRPAATLPGDPAPLEVVTSLSTAGGRHWGITIGRYGTRYQAERELLQTALTETNVLADSLRKVVERPTGWEANFVGLTEAQAAMACRRLTARERDCEAFGPG